MNGGFLKNHNRENVSERRKSDESKTAVEENDSSPHHSKGGRKERCTLKEDPPMADI